jgi:fatty acid desaturase
MDGCQLCDDITKLKKKTHTHTEHTGDDDDYYYYYNYNWWVLENFEKHSISKTYLYWIHYCISSWETMPLAFDIWDKMKKEEARFRAHTKKYENFCMVFFCLCVGASISYFFLTCFSSLLFCCFSFNVFFNEIN